jgi:hypothetical protein
MANDNFYGYSNKKPEFTLPNGNIDRAFEKVNPYEFRKGMDYELTKMGCRNLHSSTPEQREKATTIVLKNLNEMSGYYSGLISYETEYRGREKKPSFKKYMESMADHGMKEINKEFKNDKMAKITLKESINRMVREELNPLGKKFSNYNTIEDFEEEYEVEIPQNMLDKYNVERSNAIFQDITLDDFNKFIKPLMSNGARTENKMTKRELDQMIMEELEAYLREEEEIEVDVEDDAEDGNSEDVLRKIYDMLKDMFEGEEEAEEDEEDEEEDEEAGEDEEEDEEVEEVEESIQLQERFQKLANIIKG